MMFRINRKIWAPLLAALVVLPMVASMAFGKTVVLFSEFKGRLINELGAPQANVTIQRSWKSSSSEGGSDETVTGPDGTFHLPEIRETSIAARFLPVQAAISQTILAIGPDGPVKLWRASKLSYDANSELDGRPLRMVCRIDKKPGRDGPVFGTCQEE